MSLFLDGLPGRGRLEHALGRHLPAGSAPFREAQGIVDERHPAWRDTAARSVISRRQRGRRRELACERIPFATGDVTGVPPYARNAAAQD